jgi:ADP-ribose pyrophosphatase YjhB (NUDIX family)
MPDAASFIFCPKCGNNLRVEGHHGQQVPVCQSADCRFVFWQNSKPCVVAMISDGSGHVLMTVRGIEPHKDKLDLPGGFLYHGEDPVAGLMREMREELGIEINVGKCVGHLVDKYGDDPFMNINLAYTVTIKSGEPRALDEIADVEWIDPQNFDRSRLAFTNNEKFLEMWYDNQQYGPSIPQKAESPGDIDHVAAGIRTSGGGGAGK